MYSAGFEWNCSCTMYSAGFENLKRNSKKDTFSTIGCKKGVSVWLGLGLTIRVKLNCESRFYSKPHVTRRAVEQFWLVKREFVWGSLTNKVWLRGNTCLLHIATLYGSVGLQAPYLLDLCESSAQLQKRWEVFPASLVCDFIIDTEWDEYFAETTSFWNRWRREPFRGSSGTKRQEWSLWREMFVFPFLFCAQRLMTCYTWYWWHRCWACMSISVFTHNKQPCPSLPTITIAYQLYKSNLLSTSSLTSSGLSMTWVIYFQQNKKMAKTRETEGACEHRYEYLRAIPDSW